MTNLERLPDTITIPGKPEEVDSSRVRGTVGHRISYEVSPNSPDYSQEQAVKEALDRGERVFRTKDGGHIFVMPDSSQFSPNSDTVLIPGKPIEVDINQTRGDRRSGIRFEINTKDGWLDSLEQGYEVRDALESGGRVFITENDDLLFINPPIDAK